MRHALLVVLLAACGATPTAAPARPVAATPAPTPSTGIPGLRWMTTLPGWRTPDPIGRIYDVPGDANAALLVAHSWLGIMDLRTGAIVNERRMDIRQMVQLQDHRLLMLDVVNGHASGTFIDPTTLDTTSTIDLGEAGADAGDLELVDAIVMPTGELVASLPGRPLAILDPKTLQVVRELSPHVGTFGLHATPSTVAYTYQKVNHASGTTSVYDTERIELATGAVSQDHRGVIAARGDAVVYGDKSMPGPTYANKGTRTVHIEHVGGVGAFDATSDRFATVDRGILRIVAMATGQLTSTFDLHDPHAGEYYDSIAFIGERVVIAFHQQVRVVDLATGQVSVAPTAAVGEIADIAVDNAGHVETLGHDHVTYADGRAVTSEVLPDKPFAGLGIGTFAYYETDWLVSYKAPDYIGKGSIVWFVDGKQVMKRAVDTPSSGISGWASHDTLVIKGRLGDQRWSRDDGRVDQGVPTVWTEWSGNIGWFELSTNDSPSDVDAEGKRAVVVYPEGPRVVDLTTGEPAAGVLPQPSCGSWVTLERGGSRVAVSDYKTMFLVDRTTQKMIASIDLGSTKLTSTSVVPSALFLRGHDEVMLEANDELTLWDPAKAERRGGRVPGAIQFATSPDGLLLAIAFDDGRVALLDYATFRAALPVHPAHAGAALPVTTSCSQPK